MTNDRDIRMTDLREKKYNEWQDIDTAPIDGTKIDLLCKCWSNAQQSHYYRRFINVRFDDDKWFSLESFSVIEDKYMPICWMQIPAIPKNNV